MTIFVEDSFDSAHSLPNVPDGHKCHRLHGHTYRIRIEISGEVNPEHGWVIDYSEVKAKWAAIKLALDHRHLNAIQGLENPTCEHIVQWIAYRLKADLPGLSHIELRETERCGVVLDCK